MKNKEQCILNPESKVNRILKIEDILYRFVNKRGSFDWKIAFKNENQKKLFSKICNQIYMRLNAFEPSEEKDTVPPTIVDAAVEIEKLISKREKISSESFTSAFIKWAKVFLSKKDVTKSIPKDLIEKIRYINSIPGKQREIKAKTYAVLDEYWNYLEESIKSGKSIKGIAKELGITRKRMELYIKNTHPDIADCFKYNPIKIDDINKVAKKIADDGMNAAAREIGCSRSGLYDLMHKQYPEIMAKINDARNNKSQQNLS